MNMAPQSFKMRLDLMEEIAYTDQRVLFSEEGWCARLYILVIKLPAHTFLIRYKQ